MLLYQTFIIACWFVFIVVWGVSALGAKRTLNWGAGWWVRALVAVFIIVGIETRGAQEFFVPQFAIPPAVGWLGALLCALGVALAIWARVYLGRNWGMPMSLKQNAELVTTGPYAYIRNPIYTGFLLAMLGSSLVVATLLWLGVFVVMGAYFIYSAKVEEKIMAREFPSQYPAYKARTKMLIPFLF